MRFYIAILAILTTGIMPCVFGQIHSAVDGYIQPLVRTNNFSGVVLVKHRGEMLHRVAYGLADRAGGIPYDIQTVSQIASVSKPFTASAIMLLQQDGLLSTDDPISKYVPDFMRGDDIRIHHLLTHTSGIPNINSLEIYEALEQQENTPGSLLTHFKDLPLEQEPGTEYSYSNSNYTLLARIIEIASGTDYGTFIADRVVAPAGLTLTGHPTGTDRQATAVGYQPVRITDIEPARKINWTAKTGNGSLYSNAPELMQWSRAFFDGKIVLPETRDLMLTEHVEHVGYGWFIRPRHGRTQYHINGRSPGYSALISYFPVEDLHIVILSNNYIPLPTQMGIDIAAMIFDLPYLMQVEGDGKTPSTVARELAGSYQFDADFYVPNQVHTPVLDAEGYLNIEWGPLLYRGDRQFINRTYWSDVEFRVDSAGVMVMDYDGFVGKKIK